MGGHQGIGDGYKSGDYLLKAILPINHPDNMSHQHFIQCLDTLDVEYKTLYIDVTTNVDVDDLYEEDIEAIGIFEARVPAHLEASIAASAALGAYHSNIPIKHLDCFEFSVYDEDGTELTPDYDADWYELADKHHACLN